MNKHDLDNMIFNLENRKNLQRVEFTKDAVREVLDYLRTLRDQAIMPKFKIGQEVFMVIDKIEKGKIEKVIATVSKSEEESFTLYSLTDSYGYALRLPEEQIFATKEGAEKGFAELKGEGK